MDAIESLEEKVRDLERSMHRAEDAIGALVEIVLNNTEPLMVNERLERTLRDFLYDPDWH